MSFLSPVPGEKICADITGGYASLTPGYYLKTRSGLIKWSRAYTALHWIKNPRRENTVGGFVFGSPSLPVPGSALAPWPEGFAFSFF
jgi:hypothetical protein